MMNYYINQLMKMKKIMMKKNKNGFINPNIFKFKTKNDRRKTFMD